jgi:hypothetical protein
LWETFQLSHEEAVTAKKPTKLFMEGRNFSMLSIMSGLGTLIKSSHGPRREEFCLAARSRVKSIAAALRDERATKPQGKRTPALRVAYFLASDFVARQSKTAEGILLPRASSEAKK